MSNAYKTWIYHATEEAKIINSDEYEKYYKEGWQDSPAPFLLYEDLGLDSDKIKAKDDEEIVKASIIFKAVEGVIDCINGELNLDEMSKSELEDYARKHLKIELDRRRSKKRLCTEIREALNDDSE